MGAAWWKVCLGPRFGEHGKGVPFHVRCQWRQCRRPRIPRTTGRRSSGYLEVGWGGGRLLLAPPRACPGQQGRERRPRSHSRAKDGCPTQRWRRGPGRCFKGGAFIELTERSLPSVPPAVRRTRSLHPAPPCSRQGTPGRTPHPPPPPTSRTTVLASSGLRLSQGHPDVDIPATRPGPRSSGP